MRFLTTIAVEHFRKFTGLLEVIQLVKNHDDVDDKKN